MKEIVVISGKGGTGKTSIAASFAVLADRPVVADCDVDAADLHLILAPEPRERHEFRSGRVAVVRPADCTGCGVCAGLCRFGAAAPARGGTVYAVDPVSCEGCGVCVRFCPARAIDFPERLCGEWMVSETRCGPMVHARLAAAVGNSGKLVATVRREARRVAAESDRGLIVVGGPPGIGCPVIASVGGASLVVAVAEATVSGAHDLDRVLSLARHFNVRAAVCVNKWDINPAAAEAIEAMAADRGAVAAGRVPYDPAVTESQIRGTTIVEHGGGPAAAAVAECWKTICSAIS